MYEVRAVPIYLVMHYGDIFQWLGSSQVTSSLDGASISCNWGCIPPVEFKVIIMMKVTMCNMQFHLDSDISVWYMYHTYK